MRLRANGFTLAIIGAVLSVLGTAMAGRLPPPESLNSGWLLQEAPKVPESGAVISRAVFQPVNWRPATVPGTVLTSLVNDGVYPEPLYGENNRTNVIPDTLCRSPWWYRTTFSVPASYSNRHVWIDFEGVNYIAEVWVNGRSVGAIKGAFARGIFDVTPYVTVGASNGLAVRLLPPPHPGQTHEKTIANAGGSYAGVTAKDGPTFLCSIGWLWIRTIRDRDTGIWQGVRLAATGPVVLEDPYVVSKLPLPSTNSADVTVEATVRNVTDKAQAATVSGAISAVKFQEAIFLAPHEARVVRFSPQATPALHFQNPKLWWPNGYGPQNLYSLHLAVSAEGQISDARDLSFGIRQITYELPGSDNLALSVNGVPVIAKGGDWGMDEAMKRNPRSRLEAEIRLHALANYTIIRNWVGQSTSEDFYDLCDRYGILVWDEFFQPNPGDGPEPDDNDLYLANVREKILRFRNHPCIALWCGRNEGNPPPAINAGNSNLVAALDPARLYQPSSTSGHGVISWGPYEWQKPAAFYSFGNWEVFKTEIGSMSVPTLESIQAMMPARDWDVVNDDWAEHGFCPGGLGTDGYLDMLATRYGPLTSLADFVRKAQLANYEAFRAMYEARFARLFRPVTAIITWMSQPAEPGFLWQIYGYDLEPNASYFAVRKACEPLHVEMSQTNWHLLVINDAPRRRAGLTVKTTICNLDGAVQYTRADAITAAPAAATDLGAIFFPADLAGVHFVKLELRGADSNLLSDNFYWRAPTNRPDDFQELNNLPLVPLDVKARGHDENGKYLLDASVRNRSSSVALFAHFQLRKSRSGARVLPVYYSDNYVSLLPNESKTFHIEAASADLEGEAPLLALDGWNVTVNTNFPSEIRVIDNAAAQVDRRQTVKTESPGKICINCGGGPLGYLRFGEPTEGFVSDRYVTGGSTEPSPVAIDTSAPGAAPPAVYQTERWADCAYAIPVNKGHSYAVRFHFAETKYGPGRRRFNVAINGKRVLADFDIAAEVGKNKAVVKDFGNIAPDDNGHIVIRFSRGSKDEPKVCGIEVTAKD